MLPVRIKICGITTPEMGRMAVEAGADALGVVFAPGSPRCVTREIALSIRAAVPSGVPVVAVVAGPGAGHELARQWPGPVQVHGQEDEAEVAAIGRPVIRGFPFNEGALRRWNECSHVAALLVDGPAAGSGEGFDHALLAALMSAIRKPVILAGGLTAASVAGAIRVVRPYAVDVSSGVESRPGVKDPARVRDFCDAVRGAL